MSKTKLKVNDLEIVLYSEKEDENPAIGIIICKSKKRTIVEYALQDAKKPIGVASYTISEKLPSELKDYLPSSLDLKNQLENFIENEEENKN